jgi:hypothetical protein
MGFWLRPFSFTNDSTLNAVPDLWQKRSGDKIEAEEIHELGIRNKFI